MKHFFHFPIRAAVLALCICFAAVSALAAAEPYLKKNTASRNATYITGGVGENERAELLDRQPQYNVKCIFALQNGNYLANIPVTIKTGNGDNLLKTITNGPWILADLPDGVYSIRAEYRNDMKNKTIRIDGTDRTQYIFFHW